jgi:PIN domain nuclease of toxin-antitoxin system
MRVLIDTHILIWHLEGNSQLPPSQRQIISDPTNNVFISVASFWEIAIKSSRGKLSLSRSIEEIVKEVRSSTSSILLIEPEHTAEVAKLPFHHNDPFDRMIIAQAIVEDMTIITIDKNFGDYGVIVF